MHQSVTLPEQSHPQTRFRPLSFSSFAIIAAAPIVIPCLFMTDATATLFLLVAVHAASFCFFLRPFAFD
jgi:hypothetical protein